MRQSPGRISLILALSFTAACKDESKSSSSNRSDETPATDTPATDTSSASDTDTATTTNPPVVPGTVAILGTISGEILPKEGAAASSAANAIIIAEGHPEISGKTDATGNFNISNVMPGSVALYVASADGTSLNLAESGLPKASTFGLKIPDILVKAGEVNDIGQKVLKKTGGITGRIVFYSNPNSLDLTGSDVFVPGTGFLVKTDATGAFTLSGLPPGSYKIRAQHTGFAVLDIADIEIVEDQTTNLGDVALSLSSGPEGSIVLTADAVKTIGAKTNAKIMKTKTVAVALTFDKDAALMKISDEPSFTNKEWQPVSATSNWTFASDGWKTLYVMYSDLNGLESSPFSVEFVVDSELPVISSVNLMHGWTQISSTATKTTVETSASDSGTGIEYMMLSNSSNFASNSGWLPFDAAYANWTPAADTWVKVKDFADRESAAVTDHINLGTYSIIRSGTYTGNLYLAKASGPFRVENAVTITGNLTVEAGTTLDVNLSASGKTVAVLGRAALNGTSGEKITLTISGTNFFGGFDTSDSTIENHVLSHINVTSMVSGSILAVIDGGTVSYVNVSAANLGHLIMKKGYATLLVERNTVTNGTGPVFYLLGGTAATTIRHNYVTSSTSAFPVIISHAGDTETVVEYNTLLKVLSSAAATATTVGFDAGSNAVYSHNIIEATHTGSATTTVQIGTGVGETTFEHNNLKAANVASTMFFHNGSATASIVSLNNKFTGCTGCIGYPASATYGFGGSNVAAITDSTRIEGAWPTAGTKASGCVGHACTD